MPGIYPTSKSEESESYQLKEMMTICDATVVVFVIVSRGHLNRKFKVNVKKNNLDNVYELCEEPHQSDRAAVS